MGNQQLIEQYKKAYKKANGYECPYEISYSRGVFYLEDRNTGFDYQCGKDEFIRITYSLNARASK